MKPPDPERRRGARAPERGALFRNSGAQDLELMIVGIAAQKGVLETVEGGTGRP